MSCCDCVIEEWSFKVGYQPGDIVTYKGLPYVAVNSSQGVEPNPEEFINWIAFLLSDESNLLSLSPEARVLHAQKTATSKGSPGESVAYDARGSIEIAACAKQKMNNVLVGSEGISVAQRPIEDFKSDLGLETKMDLDCGNIPVGVLTQTAQKSLAGYVGSTTGERNTIMATNEHSEYATVTPADGTELKMAVIGEHAQTRSANIADIINKEPPQTMLPQIGTPYDLDKQEYMSPSILIAKTSSIVDRVVQSGETHIVYDLNVNDPQSLSPFGGKKDECWLKTLNKDGDIFNAHQTIINCSTGQSMKRVRVDGDWAEWEGDIVYAKRDLSNLVVENEQQQHFVASVLAADHPISGLMVKYDDEKTLSIDSIDETDKQLKYDVFATDSKQMKLVLTDVRNQQILDFVDKNNKGHFLKTDLSNAEQLTIKQQQDVGPKWGNDTATEHTLLMANADKTIFLGYVVKDKEEILGVAVPTVKGIGLAPLDMFDDAAGLAKKLDKDGQNRDMLTDDQKAYLGGGFGSSTGNIGHLVTNNSKSTHSIKNLNTANVDPKYIAQGDSADDLMFEEIGAYHKRQEDKADERTKGIIEELAAHKNLDNTLPADDAGKRLVGDNFGSELPSEGNLVKFTNQKTIKTSFDIASADDIKTVKVGASDGSIGDASLGMFDDIFTKNKIDLDMQNAVSQSQEQKQKTGVKLGSPDPLADAIVRWNEKACINITESVATKAEIAGIIVDTVDGAKKAPVQDVADKIGATKLDLDMQNAASQNPEQKQKTGANIGSSDSLEGSLIQWNDKGCVNIIKPATEEEINGIIVDTMDGAKKASVDAVADKVAGKKLDLDMQNAVIQSSVQKQATGKNIGSSDALEGSLVSWNDYGCLNIEKTATEEEVKGIIVDTVSGARRASVDAIADKVAGKKLDLNMQNGVSLSNEEQLVVSQNIASTVATSGTIVARDNEDTIRTGKKESSGVLQKYEATANEDGQLILSLAQPLIANRDAKVAQEISVKTDPLKDEISANSKANMDEIARAKVAEALITKALEEETARAKAAEQGGGGDIKAETARAKAAEKANSDNIVINKDNLSKEVIRATAKEALLQTDIAAESTRAQEAEISNKSLLLSETLRAEGVEKTLTDGLGAESTRAKDKEAILQTNIDLKANKDLTGITPEVATQSSATKQLMFDEETGNAIAIPRDKPVDGGPTIFTNNEGIDALLSARQIDVNTIFDLVNINYPGTYYLNYINPVVSPFGVRDDGKADGNTLTVWASQAGLVGLIYNSATNLSMQACKVSKIWSKWEYLSDILNPRFTPQAIDDASKYTYFDIDTPDHINNGRNCYFNLTVKDQCDKFCNGGILEKYSMRWVMNGHNSVRISISFNLGDPNVDWFQRVAVNRYYEMGAWIDLGEFNNYTGLYYNPDSSDSFNENAHRKPHIQVSALFDGTVNDAVAQVPPGGTKKEKLIVFETPAFTTLASGMGHDYFPNQEYIKGKTNYFWVSFAHNDYGIAGKKYHASIIIDMVECLTDGSYKELPDEAPEE